MSDCLSFRPSIIDRQALMILRQAIHMHSGGRIFPPASDAIRLGLTVALAAIEDGDLWAKVDKAKPLVRTLLAPKPVSEPETRSA